jgi:hypothetical protein
MAEIYALFSARDGKVRYVGETTGSRIYRFERHKRGVGFGRFIPRVEIWMRSEWREGHPVECAFLQTVSDEARFQVEEEWISKFPNLLNEKKYRYRGGTPPIVPEIREYMRNHISNCGGFRGIFRWCELDCFSVLTESGEWLLGDAAPGWGGNIFFPDRTEALKARDRYRQGRNCTWMPDIEPELE